MAQKKPAVNPYRVVTALDHNGERYEQGDVVQLPNRAAEWLLRGGHIEPVDGEGEEQ